LGSALRDEEGESLGSGYAQLIRGGDSDGSGVDLRGYEG
jgi:hypothetical protein